jgi:hypothetical protein
MESNHIEIFKFIPAFSNHRWVTQKPFDFFWRQLKQTIFVFSPFLKEQISIGENFMLSLTIQVIASIEPVGQPVPLSAEFFQIRTAIIVQPFGIRTARCQERNSGKKCCGFHGLLFYGFENQWFA